MALTSWGRLPAAPAAEEHRVADRLAALPRSAHRLLQFRTQGKAMVFVSHMSNAVAEMSDRVLWLDAGKVRAIGPSNEVIGMYDSYLNRRIARRALARAAQPPPDRPDARMSPDLSPA